MKKTKPFAKILGQQAIPIYCSCHFTLIATNDMVYAMNQLPEKQFPELNIRDAAGMAIQNGKGDFVIIFDVSYLDHSTVAHEIMHVTSYVGGYIGMKLAHKTAEPYAYLNGWLHEFVYGKLKKHSYKVRYN